MTDPPEPADPHDLVEQHWPYNGPYSPRRTEDAITVVAELVRYLNNATRAEKGDSAFADRNGVPYAASAGRVLDSMSTATHRLDQLLAQLAGFHERQADDDTLYDDRRDRPGAITANEIAAHLEGARASATALAAQLLHAARAAHHLGNDEPNPPDPDDTSDTPDEHRP